MRRGIIVDTSIFIVYRRFLFNTRTIFLFSTELTDDFCTDREYQLIRPRLYATATSAVTSYIRRIAHEHLSKFQLET